MRRPPVLSLHTLAVAIDCEMVASGNQSVLAKVSIVDRQGNVLLDEYVKPTATVTDYRTEITGISKSDLDDGKIFENVRNRVANIISGKFLVGHSLHFDLGALNLSHPEERRRDLAKYPRYLKNNQPQSLRDLAEMYLNKLIHQGVHDSVEDAKISMQLYARVANDW